MNAVKRQPVHEIKWIIGVDEVGRGPLAGPITVAAVAAPVISDFRFQISNLKGIRDSKQLSPMQRQKWDSIIRKKFPLAISSVSNNVIDAYGIMFAIRSAVSCCILKVARKFEIRNLKFEIFLDGGLFAPPQYRNQQTITKGDEKVPIIAAASIVAKVHRDRYMTRLHRKFPQYGFDRHKGYGTEFHRAAISEHGLSPVHRKTFCKTFLANGRL